MKCPICKGVLNSGKTDITFKRDRKVIVIENVPALICTNCGEAIVDSSTSQKAYNIAEEEMKRGVTLEFYNFAA